MMASCSLQAQKLLERIACIDQKCCFYSKSTNGKEIIESCQAKLNIVKTRLQNEQIDSTLLHDYTKALLDFTFFEENELVDDDFSDDDAEKQLITILDSLSEVDQLCEDFLSNTVNNVLGVEIAECLLWRKGALLYMYCHSKQADKEWLEMNKLHFFKLIHRGVTYLKEMVEVRNATIHNSQALELLKEENCKDPWTLLEIGVFSDCHMLALMYGGEMCYWYMIKVQECDLIPENSFNAVQTGIQLLSLYILAAEGPLKPFGWNCEKAKRFKEYLSTCGS